MSNPTPAPIRSLVVGAGALGGYFGGRMFAAGRDVTFLVRPGTAQTLNALGLHLISPKGDVHLKAVPTVLAADLAADPNPFDLILLACKAQDLDSALADFGPAVGPDTLILPLLNGMAHLAVLDARFSPEKVLGGGCVISATRAQDGTIHHLNSLDRLFFGARTQPASPRLDSVAATLDACGFDSDLRPDVLEDMWLKWTFIAASAGITCLMRGTIGDIVAAGATPITRRLFDECLAIATAAGYPPPAAYVEMRLGYLTKAGSAFTASMLRDLESGAPIEAQQIIGDLLTHARRSAIPTPILEVVHAHLLTYEARRIRERATR